MERKHADRLREKFPAEIAGKTVIVLRIADDYPSAHDPALIARLRSALAPHISGPEPSP